ncbi:unnamed protein product [Pocillopora meandrina]|uniref:PABS domain-containing protein n=1 Tax=Pocillopora meandrina TaxID=46732 RepID=A0AAU9VSI1_9CNID|nr:unnamed protein product [Pocillopora meandrina]
MAKHSIFDFQSPDADLKDDVLRSRLFEILRKYASGPVISTELEDGKSCLFIFVGENGGHWILRSYSTGLITLDVMQCGKEEILSKDTLKSIEKEICKVLSAEKSLHLPPINRGAKVNTYYPTVDDLLIQYDFDRLEFETNSPYQNIKILHSQQFGNILILDDDINLAESDFIYTKTITGSGREVFKDKTILILGGGDGGILNELLQCSPEFVTMVDIDEDVINCAIKYLRGICGNALDNLSGEHHKVHIGDCVKYLEQCIEEGRTFDYVINDLTAIPVTKEPIGSLWEFLRLILDMSMKVLSPSGKYFTQGNSYNKPDALLMYEQQLTKLSCPVQFRKEDVFVPSYHEKWVFYEIWKTNESTLS